MITQERYLTIDHGKLRVKVPFSIFKDSKGTIDVERSIPFRKLIRERYPWVTENSLDVLLRKARQEYVRLMDEESKGKTIAKELEENGKIDEAIAHLKRHLEKDPNDADSWYALGDVLCRAGRTEEGYKAYARGRNLF